MKYEGVYVILQACSILVRKNIPIKMIFVGSGEEYEGMFQYVKEYHLEKNVLICGRIPKEAGPALQRRGDICPGAACSRRPFPVTSERKWVPSGGIAEMGRLASIAIYKIALSEPCKGEFAIL